MEFDEKFQIYPEDIELNYSVNFEELMENPHKISFKRKVNEFESEDKEIEFEIPYGLEDGTIIVIPEKGHISENRTGNLYIRINMLYKGFKRKGSNAYISREINYTQWKFGSNLDIHFFDEDLIVKVPKEVDNGQVLRIPGHGYSDLDFNHRGDLFIKIIFAESFHNDFKADNMIKNEDKYKKNKKNPNNASYSHSFSSSKNDNNSSKQTNSSKQDKSSKRSKSSKNRYYIDPIVLTILYHRLYGKNIDFDKHDYDFYYDEIFKGMDIDEIRSFIKEFDSDKMDNDNEKNDSDNNEEDKGKSESDYYDNYYYHEHHDNLHEDKDDEKEENNDSDELNWDEYYDIYDYDD